MANEHFEGEGIPFYRCVLCAHVVSYWDIEESHGCPKCGNVKIKPTNLTILEKLVQIIKHPKLWLWKEKAAKYGSV